MNYSCDVFGFLNVINPLTDFEGRVELGKSYYRSVEIAEFDTLHELAVSGEVYRVKTLKDYKVSDCIHMLELDVALPGPLEAEEGLVIQTLLLDLPGNNAYTKVMDIIKNSDDTIDVAKFAPEEAEIEGCLANLLLEEYRRKCDFLMDLTASNSPLKRSAHTPLLDLIKKHSKYEVNESVSSYIINSMDVQASFEHSHELESTEYRVQEPFFRSAGIVSKKTGEVRLLSGALILESSTWSSMTARSLWKKAGEPENRATAEYDTAMDLTLRGLDAIQLSLALRGVTVEGERIKGFKKRRLIRRLKKNLR